MCVISCSVKISWRRTVAKVEVSRNEMVSFCISLLYFVVSVSSMLCFISFYL